MKTRKTVNIMITKSDRTWCETTPDSITQPKGLNSRVEFDAAPMRCFGWVRAKNAPYFFYWVGSFFIS